jgi:dTDP-4-dehydrorhamnose reductase
MNEKENSGTLLITGVSGMLGSSLLSLARKQDRRVVGLYHQHPVSMPGVELLAADLTNEDEPRKIFREVKPSAVIHCAAATGVDWCEEHPEEAHRINVNVPSMLAAITNENQIDLLHISTDAVFDGERGNYIESDQPKPTNIYAATKSLAETEVLLKNPAAVIARVNLYGCSAYKRSANKTGLAEWILRKLAAGSPLPGFSDVIFCPIFADDLAEILLAMLYKKLSGVYHVVGREAISKYEFAVRVASAFGFDPALVVAARIDDAGLKARRPRNTSLNTSKVCAALGRSMPGVDEGLRSFAKVLEAGPPDWMKGEKVVTQQKPC